MSKVHDERLPLIAARVGKWWGLFRVPPTARQRDGRQQNFASEPEVLSWHATEAEAEQAAAELARSWRPGVGRNKTCEEFNAELDEEMEDGR